MNRRTGREPFREPSCRNIGINQKIQTLGNGVKAASESLFDFFQKMCKI